KRDIGCPDQLVPLVGEIDNVFADLHMGACEYRIAKLGNAPLDPAISKAGIDFHVELLDDLGRRVPWSADSVPPGRIIARHEFGEAWNIRQCFCAPCARYRQRAQLARPYMFDEQRHIADVRLHLFAEWIDENR